MKYYIIAGEASGDLHGSNLVKNIKKFDNNAEFRGLGGDKMEAEGVSLAIHYEKTAFMGVFEVLANLKTIKNNFRICKADILDFQPDAVILIDYAGFNLRIAKYAKENNFKTLFYISPKVWAWKKSRVKKIKATVDYLYLILPFEKEFFAKRGYDKTLYIGNPLTDAIDSFNKQQKFSREEFLKKNQLEDKPIIALLAGSRKQEIERILPEMLRNIKKFPEYQFVLAGAPSIQPELYNNLTKGYQIKVLYDRTYEILSQAHAAVVTSGTATLETGLFKVPQVVVYKFQTLSFLLFRPFIWVKYFSLVNIIMKKEVVKELLQFGLARKINNELRKILYDEVYYNQMMEEYNKLSDKIGNPGTSERAAKHMVEYLKAER